MRFEALTIDGAFRIEPEAISDDRGFFAHIFCEREFAERRLVTNFPQWSVSYNIRKGTLRGMHFQAAPHAEVKLVRCTRGNVYDVIVDLRPDSTTYLRWTYVELSALNRAMIYIPTGVAHGFQTLSDDSEMTYYISEPYHAESARGVRHDDPAFAIRWPIDPRIMNDRDRNFADHQREGAS